MYFIYISDKAESERISKTHIVTAPLFYVNSKPHIGHVYTSVLADSVARWFEFCSSRGSGSYLVVGSDEHGSKILESAKKSGVPVENHCSIIHAHFIHLYNLANVRHSACVRTSSPQHEANVCVAFKRLEQAGHIYAGEYIGWYTHICKIENFHYFIFDSIFTFSFLVLIGIRCQTRVMWVRMRWRFATASATRSYPATGSNRSASPRSTSA